MYIYKYVHYIYMYVCMYICMYICIYHLIIRFKIQFHTNVSQLVRHVLPGSYTSLASLRELTSSSLNRLSVCLSCLYWLRISLVCTVHMYCVSDESMWSWFQREKFFFRFFPKKSGLPPLKKMVWRQSWRVDDIRSQTSSPPHLTTWRQTWQLRWRVHTDIPCEVCGIIYFHWQSSSPWINSRDSYDRQ